MTTANPKIMSRSLCLAILVISLSLSDDALDAYGAGSGQDRAARNIPGFKTNTAKRLISLDQLQAAGPGKDGIPAIDRPVFVKPQSAQKWLKPVEPVISLVIKGRAKAYPLQILIWHEIVNDRLADVPVAVSFCPLCYSASVFERKINGVEYTFGVSGMLRHSDLVMYDRQTETLWQQLTGRAIVGDMVGAALKKLPAQIISFDQFRAAYKDGLVLSRKTGFRRNYGRNPYAGYDNISNTPFLYRGKADDRLPPMEKLVTVTVGGSARAYPYSVTEKLRAVNDSINDVPIAVFHDNGAVSALDRARIASSREVGSTGVFNRQVADRVLTFAYIDGKFLDEQTLSTWDITGRAIKGTLKGTQLTPLPHGDYFAFAWLAFKPQTQIYNTELTVK